MENLLTAELKDIRVLKHGIRYKGKYHRAWYSKGKLINHPEGTITVYARDYSPLPQVLKPQNDSDAMTDYFEKDRARIEPTHPLYNEFLKLAR